MPQPRVLILRAPGTNCDLETAHAFARAEAIPERLHLLRLVENPGLLRAFQILCVPGGFSYGDDLGAGRVAAIYLRRRLADELHAFRDAGKLILGICNGFQVLLRSGLLVEESQEAGTTLPRATLAWNASGRFEDRWVTLQVCSQRSPFFQGIERLELPVAHAEGRFVPRSPDVLASLQAAGRIVLRYVAPGGEVPAPYPYNPNGSADDVAAVCDATGQVCGLMPHPERHIDGTHHPQWTRRGLQPAGDGLRVFENAVAWFG